MKSKSKSKQPKPKLPKPPKSKGKAEKRKGAGDGAEPIQIEWQESAGTSATFYDESNPLVIVPSKKKKDGTSKPSQQSSGGSQVKRGKSKATAPPSKLLSKKQRKKLEKIVERREKKKNRAELIEELQQYQLPQDVFNKLTPLVKIQTEGIRKLFMDEAGAKAKAQREGDGASKLNSIKGAYRKKRLAAMGMGNPFSKDKGPKTRDLNVLGFDSSSTDSESESEESELEESTKKLKEAPNARPNSQSATPTSDPPQSKPPASGPANSTGPLTPIASKTTQNEEKAKKATPVPSKVPRIPAKFVFVDRTEATIKARSKLPIIPEESAIMEAITDNPVVVLAGETGCGKTTQVPQFLYEAGYAESRDGKPRLIGVTEPRRVAAMAMSGRVGTELNLPKGSVSYQIRFEGDTSPNTKIKFMTDGVLLKEMEADFLLSSYSVICIDEAHERSLYTDILIGLLSRAVRLREKRGDPLKLVIMSATLKAEEFLQNRALFKQEPAFIHVPARQFPVQIHFSKHTPAQYLDAARKRVTAIHNKLPPGGILVFVTGQLEVKQLTARLEAICSAAQAKADKGKIASKRKRDSDSNAPDMVDFDLDKIQTFPDELDSDEEESQSGDEMEEEDESELVTEPLHIIPLYSMLPMRDQKKVFQPPPEGSRLCVIATNVAETSLTIPNIRYVVDCGKVKDKYWDKLTGVQGFRVNWCSKASAEQRAGRAGRTGPGHCYRLYSSAVFDSDFPAFSKPEILLRPVDDMVLLMKSMSITKVRHFPYPTAPDLVQITAAEKLLTLLGAIEAPTGNGLSMDMDNSMITPLGKTMSRLPVNPRFSKMLSLGSTHNVLEYVVALVAALTVQEVLLEAHQDKDANNRWTQLRRKWVEAGSRILLGDAMVLIAAISEFEGTDLSVEAAQRLGVRHKAMVEIRKLRKQLTGEIKQLANQNKSTDFDVDLNYRLPSSDQCTVLRQIILSGCPDKIAKRLDPEELAHAKLKSKHAAYWAPDLDEPVFLHSGSVLKGLRPAYIVFQEAFEIGGTVYLRGVTAIEPHWIPEICPHNQTYGVPAGRLS